MISIHAPRVGSDECKLVVARRILRFQSTLPAWGATALRQSPTTVTGISIHAPRVGSDMDIDDDDEDPYDFNPRSPRGERLVTL